MKTRIAILSATMWMAVCLPVSAADQANVSGGASLSFNSPYHDGTVSLAVSGRGYSFSAESESGDIPRVNVSDTGMEDGLYSYEVRWSNNDGDRTRPRVQTGSFIVRGGIIQVAAQRDVPEI